MAKISTSTLTEPFVIVSPERAGEKISSIQESIITDLYKKFGAILFRGFSCDQEILAELAEQYCTNTLMNRSPGRTTIDEDANIQTVNLGTAPFSLHPELSRLPWKPDVCWFCCLTPPESGGETIICDGIQIVKEMNDPIRNAFATRRLRYTSPLTSEESIYWFGSDSPTEHQLQNPPKNCPFEIIDLPQQTLKSFTFPALHKPMFSSDLAFGNFLLFARYTKQNLKFFPTFEDGTPVPDELVTAVKKISDKISVPIQWQKSDLLMLDNTRFMHGRNKILDDKNRLILSLFGYLKFAKPNSEELANAPWRIKGAHLPC